MSDIEIEIRRTTEAEAQAAAGFVQGIMDFEHDNGMVVVLEVMSLLAAFYCARVRDMGHDNPQEAMREMIAQVTVAADAYDDMGLIGAHEKERRRLS